jgi:hypothetical protein
VREPGRVLTKPLASEPLRDSDPVRTRDNEECTVRLNAKPSEALIALPIPLACEAPMLREPDKPLASPLLSEPPIESEPAIDLRNESCSATAKD